MVAKIISATDVRVGTNMIEDSLFYTVKKIDISDQPKGIYFVKVSIGDKVFNEKIVYQ